MISVCATDTFDFIVVISDFIVVTFPLIFVMSVLIEDTFPLRTVISDCDDETFAWILATPVSIDEIVLFTRSLSTCNANTLP